MGESEEKNGVDGHPLSQPLTWICPEGHVVRFRRRPLLSSCMFIFCFLIMEWAAAYCLRTFLFRHLEKSMALKYSESTPVYLWVSVLSGIYDLSPILLASIGDTYLGNFKAIVVFGFMLSFGLILLVVMNHHWIMNELPAFWMNGVGLCIVAISGGGMLPLLTAFGASQFHPRAQLASGSRFFSSVYPVASGGAIIGVIISIFVYAGTGVFSNVLLASAILGVFGWIAFLFGARLYTQRCMHTHTARRFFSLLWDCVRNRSLQKNAQSKGGSYPDSLVRDTGLVARLIPVFLCLIPLYLGQLQIFTTVRTMGIRMSRPSFVGRVMPPELFLTIEPLTVIVVSAILNEFMYPALRKRNLMPSHITRLTAAAGSIMIGFIACLVIASIERTQGEPQSIFALVAPLVMFAIGQLLITSSGLELSYSYAPDSLKSVSAALFAGIYATGSLLSVGIFGSLRSLLDVVTPVDGEALYPRFDIYFSICAGLCLVSLVSLILLRSFHARTRQMKIERDVDQRALEIALARFKALDESAC